MKCALGLWRTTSFSWCKLIAMGIGITSCTRSPGTYIFLLIPAKYGGIARNVDVTIDWFHAWVRTRDIPELYRKFDLVTILGSKVRKLVHVNMNT